MTGPLLLSPFVLAELDYLLALRVGEHARTSLLAEVERGAYQLQPFSGHDVGAARKVVERYADLDLGVSLADASIVVLAERHAAREVLTLDERHFRVLKANRKPLALLPADR